MNRRKKMSGGKSSTTSKTANRMKKAMKGLKYKNGGKPDYIDIDGDGNRTESMKSAAKSKKNKKAKYGARKKKMMGGMNNMQQDPNMMQQQPMDPMANQQAPMAPGQEFIEPDRQLKFGGPSRKKAFFGGKNKAARQDRKAARQDRRAARKEMRQDRRAARQEIRQLPREERRAARQEMRQDFKERRQGIRDNFQAAKAMGPGAGALPPQKSVTTTSSRTPGAAKPAAPGAQMPPAKPPVAAGMSTGGFDKNISSAQTAFKKGGKKPREKALFGRIANAIRKGKAAKDAGGGLKDIAKGAATGAMTGTLGLASAGIKSLRSSKEKRQERKEARQERRANRKTMTRAERRADRKAARQERRAARKDRRARRTELRQTLREERRDVRANAGGDAPGSKPSGGSNAGYDKQPPPMTAMVEKGGRKNMVDRRVKKKSGGYGIEKSASGKKMADTLGVTKNRKKAVQGTRKLNKLAGKKKALERKIKQSAKAVDAEGAARMKANKQGPGKLKKQLERRRGRLDKLDSKMKRVRARKKTA